MLVTTPTKRPVSPGLEPVLGDRFNILDHGFLRVVDYMGTDQSIVEAARVSYGGGTKSARDDAALTDYLMRHRHTTPFEVCEIQFHVKLPIFVARQWLRHRTANVNEVSARYSILSREFYLPRPEDLAAQSTTNKQGRTGRPMKPADAVAALRILREDATTCFDHYDLLLNDPDGPVYDPSKSGIARELARMNLTLNTYTEMRWKIDLHNLFHFLSLRADSHAQHEIRVYADQILKVVEMWVPVAYRAFHRHRMTGVSLSGPAWEAVKRMLAGEKLTRDMTDMSVGEWREFEALLEE